MIGHEELRRRLKALRVLRGVTQVELGRQLKAEGVPEYDLARAEQGKKDMSSNLRRELARILRAPEDYFLAADVDDVLFRDAPTAPAGEAAPALGGEIGRDAEDSGTNAPDLEQTGQ